METIFEEPFISSMFLTIESGVSVLPADYFTTTVNTISSESLHLLRQCNHRHGHGKNRINWKM